MSSHIYTVDISFNQHSSTDIISYDPFNFLDVVQHDFNNSFFSSFSPPTTNHDVLPLITNGTNIFNSDLEIASKLMQGSYSCTNNFHEKPSGFPFEPCHSTLMNSQNFQLCELNSPENSFFTGQMRRACSAGDLQSIATNTHGSQTEEPNLLKVGRYGVEERKEKISKYRAKRKQRKFNKIIKYACRKTLADNRTRIRGRFACNDNETNDNPKTLCSNTEQHHEDEFWVDLIEGLNDEFLY